MANRGPPHLEAAGTAELAARVSFLHCLVGGGRDENMMPKVSNNECAKNENDASFSFSCPFFHRIFELLPERLV